MNAAFYISVGILVLLLVTIGVTFGALIPKDKSQNSNLLIVITVFSFVTSIVAYALALYYFSANPQSMMQFVLALVMLVILPSALTTAAVSTVTVSNLRETLAAS